MFFGKGVYHIGVLFVIMKLILVWSEMDLGRYIPILEKIEVGICNLRG